MRVMDGLADQAAQIMGHSARRWYRRRPPKRFSATRPSASTSRSARWTSLHCQLLLDPDQGQSLLVFTATPGTESHEKLALLSVLGTDQFATVTR